MEVNKSKITKVSLKQNVKGSKELSKEIHHNVAQSGGGRGNYDIAIAARNLVGSQAYNLGVSNGDFGPGDYKCNLFVYDVLTKAGVSPGLPNKPGFIGKLLGHNSYPPTAGQWGDPNFNIPGWRVLGANEYPMNGDVVALPHQTINASGHVGIVYHGGMFSISATANGVIISSFGFRPTENPVFRRYIGNN